ncbi:hypothetical protein KEM52_005704 [Ascosphaera acerosa]|nr:hypothetical protein KEM52_005704 [Ascosphaera acerosa]
MLLSVANRWITGTNEHDEAIALLDDRKPALYTESFGSCMPHNAISIDRFEASFFRDNMSLTFHLQGTTTLDHEDLIVSLAVLAYGERRVGMTFNPCNANLYG